MSEASKPSPAGDGAYVSIHTPVGQLYGVGDLERTLADLFEQGRSITGDGQFLGSTNGKEYSFISYNEADVIRKQIGSALRHRGLEKASLVGISSQNTCEWTLLGLGCDTQAMTMVPLYDTLGEEGVKYILNQTEMSVMFAHPKTLKSYLSYLPEVPAVKLIIKLPAPETGECTPEEIEKAKENNVELITFEEFLQIGKDNPCPPNFPGPDDLCTLCYTSGTTGFPKGAMLSHSSLASAVDGLMTHLGDYSYIASDVHISYLPASHIFERLVQSSIISVGGSMGFWQGDVKKLFGDMQVLKPSVLIAVPRILNRLYDKAPQSVLKNMLGGNIRSVACGAAPIKPVVLEFFRGALGEGAAVFEGYGQTECCGGCAVTHYGNPSVGQVGGVLNCCQIKLVDVEDMNYYAKNNEGEVCIKGPSVFKGYYKNEAKTKETLDEEGWLHTGDIGRWTEDYALKIVDRKKNIFKLSQGEYIAPEMIELLYDRAPLVGQCMIYGDSLKGSLVAVVIPDELAAAAWAKSKGLEGLGLEELCLKEELREEIMEQVNERGRAGGLKSFEFAKKLHLHHEPFSVENELTTPTFKLRRHNIAKVYAEAIEELYKGLD